MTLSATWCLSSLARTFSATTSRAIPVLLAQRRPRSVCVGAAGLTLEHPLQGLVAGPAQARRRPVGTQLLVGVDDVQVVPRGFQWQVLRCGVGWV